MKKIFYANSKHESSGMTVISQKKETLNKKSSQEVKKDII
jgi:hypothetical protein